MSIDGLSLPVPEVPTLRAGDVVALKTSGELMLVAYADGAEVSLDSVEPDKDFIARWKKNIKENWPDDAPGKPPKRPYNPRLSHDGVMLCEEWPIRKWSEVSLRDDGVEQILPREALEEVVVHATDVVLVHTASDDEHHEMLERWAAKEEVSAPCPACLARIKEDHPSPLLIRVGPQGTTRVTCAMCEDTRHIAIDRRPRVAKEQLATLHGTTELSVAPEIPAFEEPEEPEEEFDPEEEDPEGELVAGEQPTVTMDPAEVAARIEADKKAKEAEDDSD